MPIVYASRDCYLGLQIALSIGFALNHAKLSSAEKQFLNRIIHFGK